MRTPLKRIAQEAVKKLAGEMFDHGEFPTNWAEIDKIEARFHIQGCAEAFLDRWKADRQRYQDQLAAASIKRNPDNAFHLYPPQEISRLLRMAA